jgi:hypothetical protein
MLALAILFLCGIEEVLQLEYSRMEINIFAVLVSAVLAMVAGAVWYGPLFGEAWLKVIGATKLDIAEREKMQKEAGPLYAIQFALALVQFFVLGLLVSGQGFVQGLLTALVMLLAFVVPTLAGCAMWTTDSSKVKWSRFGIQSGYQLVVFVIAATVLILWA